MKGGLIERVAVLTGRRSEDPRGWLHVALGASQLPADAAFGELYVIQADDVGVRRGDHYHRQMHEWFSVVQGKATLQLRDPVSDERLAIPLNAKVPRTVGVPAGIAHCFVNDGPGPMIVVAWASAEHDPADVVPCVAG